MALLETDPVCFARDVDNELEIPLRLVSGLDAVAVGARTRVGMFAGEWFMDLDAGIPYLPDGVAIPEREAILGQKFDAIKARAAFRRELLTTPGVVEIPTLLVAFDGPSRTMTINWVLRTAFGDTPVDTLTRTI